MKKLLLGVLLSVNMLFADFNSLADEQAHNNNQAKQGAIQKQASVQQFNAKILPRIKNLQALNGLFYEKYLVKNTDTPEMIDEKFKQRQRLFAQMASDYQTLQTEYKALREAIDYGGYEEPGQSIDVPSINFVRIDGYLPIHVGWGGSGSFSPSEDSHFGIYEDYLRNAYQTYAERQKVAKEDKERAIANAKIKKDSEAKIKATAAERKKMAPACQKWRNEVNKQVYSLGVGDKIISANGAVYAIAGVNANTFTVINPMINNYLYLQKKSCLPYSALRSAPSPLCYQ